MFDQSVSDLKSGSIKAFEEIYLKFLNKVVYFAYQYLLDMNTAKCVAHDVFLSLWENRTHIEEEGNLQSYILTTTKHKCINILKHYQIESQYASKYERATRNLNLEALTDASADLLLKNEFLGKFRSSLSKLPLKTQEAFVLSRFKHLSYEEISKIQAVTVKNVEYRMMQALKFLRKDLIEFFPILLGLLTTGLYSIYRSIL